MQQIDLKQLRSILLRYGSRFERYANNEGLTPDAGVTKELLNVLVVNGHADLAFFIAKSDANIGLFRQVTII